MNPGRRQLVIITRDMIAGFYCFVASSYNCCCVTACLDMDVSSSRLLGPACGVTATPPSRTFTTISCGAADFRCVGLLLFHAQARFLATIFRGLAPSFVFISLKTLERTDLHLWVCAPGRTLDRHGLTIALLNIGLWV